MADPTYISVDLGCQHVSVARFTERSSGGMRLDGFARVQFLGDPSDSDFDLENDASQALAQCLKKLKIKEKEAAYVITSHPVLTKFASMPMLESEQVDQLVGFEAQQQVPYPINEVAWGYQLVGDPDDVELQFMLAAIKSDEMEVYDRVVRSAGLLTNGATIAPAALYNAFRYSYSDVDGCVLIIDIGARTTDLIFAEGGNLFTRMVKIGGTDISNTIAEEVGMPYAAAESKKEQDGFVGLGGAYAAHEDPEINVISKLIRNSLTRLHSDIMRNITFYRSQQGGSAPSMVLLAGGASQMPFLRDFFAEKLSVPVDFFNPMRNVTIGKGCKPEDAEVALHHLGPLLGSALASAGEVPARLELVSKSVQADRDLAKKKPLLIFALVAAAAVLGAVGFYFQRAGSVTDSAIAAKATELRTLKKHEKGISEKREKIGEIMSTSGDLIEAARHRAYWVDLFTYLSEMMEGDALYFTSIEPLANGEPIFTDEVGGIGAFNDGQEEIVDGILVKGLWRENSDTTQVVFDYFNRLKEDALARGDDAVFALAEANMEDVVEPDSGTSGDRFAYPFTMKLPLPESNQVRFEK